MPRKIKDCLSAPQFYQACEALKKHKAEFMVGKLSLPDAAKKLGEIAGLVISVSTMRKLKATTGIEWKTHRGRTNFRNTTNGNSVRTLTVALHNLYDKLGEPVPHALEMLYNNGVHLPINPH